MKLSSYIVFIIFLASLKLNSQVNCDCDIRELKRIQDTYKILRIKYENHAIEKLKFYLNKDDSLKKVFLSNDSVLTQFQIKLIPVLKFDNSARNYRYPESICKYLYYDTITYDCEVSFYFKNRNYFHVDKDWTDCYYRNIITENPYDSIIHNYHFFQNYYDGGIYFGDADPDFLFLYGYNAEFVFFVDNLSYFQIKDSVLSIKLVHGSDWDLIRKSYFTEKYIRYCARRCYCGGPPPWWKFWEWEIFYK
ncbi:MAG: hypothetical protein NT007_16320 [Candidatus Kapabacteria bacterium]|nr:hypothetical protein [Candidatus Kapabacteria bacterium]